QLNYGGRGPANLHPAFPVRTQDSRRNVSGSKTTPTASLKINCSRQPAEDDQPQFSRQIEA
ncbi:MAG TPA: hypothetical protein VFD73_23745, partial [Gemmatimonadales bacterium]|nr:hypothetical protein [Gemmatimonadales bacterium]